MRFFSTDFLKTQKASHWCWKIGVFLWAVLAFTNLYFFSYPSMDSWCYFASGVGANETLRPIAPLLGNFMSSDQVWGRHWPGGPMLLSLLRPWMPQNPVLYVLVIMVQWLAVASLLRYLAFRFFGSLLWANLAGILFLADRVAFDVAWFYRSEFFVLIGQLFLVLALKVWTETSRKKLWLLGVAAASFMEPLLHPVALAAMGLFVLLGFVLAWKDRRYLPWALTMAGASLCGVAALILYYVLQPVAIAILQDHARNITELTWGQGAKHYFGRTLVYFYESYRPFFITGPILILTALTGGFLLLRKTFGKEEKDRPSSTDLRAWFAVGYWMISQALISQSSYNGYYLVLMVPFAILLALYAVRTFCERPLFPRIALWTLVLIFLLHLSLWPLRLTKWAQLGFVNYHSKLRGIYTGLPEASLVLIPEVLWEEGLRGSRPVLLNTLPNLCSEKMRDSYDQFLIEKIKPGDILVHDRFQSQRVGVLEKFPQCWEKIDEAGLNWKGMAKAVGFECVIYRAVSSPGDRRQIP